MRSRYRSRRLRAIFAVLLVFAAATAEAAEWSPKRPVRMVVPYPPGGAVDTVGRIVASALPERLGYQAVIDNRGGANGIIGTELVARAVPDGQTILVASSGHAIKPTVTRKLPYDTLKDFAAIGLVGSSAYLLVVAPSLPAKTVKEFIALAKARPGQLSYAFSGHGNTTHIAGELFKVLAGIDMLAVNYKGGGPALTDVMGGHVTAFFSGVSSGTPHVKAGRLRGLGVTTKQRSSALPDVPTLDEAGVPSYEMDSWYGLLAPAATPAAVIARYDRELVQLLGTAEIRERMRAAGVDARSSTPTEFRDLIARDIARFADVVKKARIAAE